MENKKLVALRDEPIPRLIRRFFWPAFVGVMANSLYNIVDRIFIGQAVGPGALSGITAVFPVMVIMMAFGMLIGLGGSVVLSISLGKQAYKRAEDVVRHTVVLIIVISVLFSLLGFAVKGPLLEWFGATEATVGYANKYLNIILWGAVLQIFGFSMNTLIRAEGNARIAMYSMLISAGVNIPMDALFILVLDWGVQGAAAATLVSMAALSAWVLNHFLSARSVVKLRMRQFTFNWPVTRFILGAGMAPFLMQVSSSVVQAMFNHQLIKYGGDIAVGAMGAIMSIVVLIIMSMVALNMASQPIIGYNYGAGNLARVRTAVRLGIIYSTLVAIGSWLIIQSFPYKLVSFFSNNAELIRLGGDGLRVFMALLPIIGFQIIVSNYFRSVGKAKTAAVLSLLRQVIVLIPMLLILPRFWGLQGIWLAGPVADTIAAFLSAALMLRDWRTTLKGSLRPSFMLRFFTFNR